MTDTVRRASGSCRAMVRGLRERLRELGDRHGDRINVRAGEHWIAVRSSRHGRVFAELRPSRNGLVVFILPRPGLLRDPRNLARAAPRTQGWGWFRTRFDVRSPDDVGAAFRLIRQSYIYGSRNPNGRHGHRP